MEVEPWDESEPGALSRVGSLTAPVDDGAAVAGADHVAPSARTKHTVRSLLANKNVTQKHENGFINFDAGEDNPIGSYEYGHYDSEEVDADVSASQADIRQEALKVLEMADAPTRNSVKTSKFAVHRTSAGGFAAGLSSDTSARRIHSALSGSLFTTNRTNSPATSSYRDDPNKRQCSSVPSSEDLEYGDEDVVDAIAKVQRTTTSSSSSNWSSRYSVDRNLASVPTSRSLTTKEFLDKMDRGFAKKTSATGLTASSAYDSSAGVSVPVGAANSNLFGSGFSFRQSDVWGKQGVTVEADTNLYDAGDQLPDLPARKSWQEQVRLRKRQRRNLAFGVIGLLVFIVTLSTTVARKKRTMASENHMTIYVTSDAPYTVAEQKKLARDFKSIRSNADLLFHVGNIQNVTATSCELSQYLEVSAMLQETKIPTFVIPGEMDWVNCPHQELAFERWANTFVRFAQKTSHSLEVDYQQHRMENFAFQENRVLFMGVHVVGGKPTTYDEFENRMKDNTAWIKAMYNLQADDVDGVIVFGNAAPGLMQLQEFFDTISAFLGSLGKPILYIHSNSGSSNVNIYKPFSGYSNIVAIQAPAGGKQPPLPINIGTGKHLFTIGGLDVPYRI